MDHRATHAPPERSLARPRTARSSGTLRAAVTAAAVTIWHCLVCDAITYGPPFNTHRHTAIGPAAVRHSTHRGDDAGA